MPQQLDPRKLEDVCAAPAFGPRGLLLVGFSEQDCGAVQAWFHQMEPGFVVAPCSTALLSSGTLGDALGSADGNGTAIPERSWEALPAGGQCSAAGSLQSWQMSYALNACAAVWCRSAAANYWSPCAAGTPPVAFFSGISGQEQVALMEAWADCTGLESPAFASGLCRNACHN